ncbi:MAG: hypothetical protein HY273_14200 [Gammaproteobacteria bacterium]|nr:hypothetical protein [Gammaproteobacteria bacterium]
MASVLLMLPLTSAFAAGKDGPTTYQVEVLIFAVNDATALAAESWPEYYETAGTGQLLYITATEAGGKPAPTTTPSKDASSKKPAVAHYQFLPHDQFKLTASIAKLKKNPRYEVLLHTSWRQPAIDLKDETAVYVFEGMTEPEHPVDPLPAAGTDALAAAPQAHVSEAGNPDPRAPRFSGTVKLALGQYLHVALDLLYRKEMSRVGSVDASGKEVLTTHNALQSFHLNEIRRIKVGEVNYFDHPVFGALVLVASAEKNKAGDVEKETVGADSPAPAVLPDD